MVAPYVPSWEGSAIGLAFPLWVTPLASVGDRSKPQTHTTYPWGGMQWILGVLKYSLSGLVGARHKSRSGLSLLSFFFLILISVGLNFRDRVFLGF